MGRLLPELLPRRRCRVTQNTTLGRLPKRMKLPRVDLRGLPESLAFTREDVIEIVGEAMKQVVEAIRPEVKRVEEPPPGFRFPSRMFGENI